MLSGTPAGCCPPQLPIHRCSVVSRKGREMSRNPDVLARTIVRAAVGGLVVAALSIVALAQGVTGTVTGTVRDPQGGVIHGATVTMISEARNTVSAPAVTNAQGDFVFPNVTADTYTI